MKNKKITVLIVDDHAVVRQGLRSYLELQDNIIIVGEAGNGMDAVKQAKALKPDIVLMDLVMPGLDGVEATRKICELGLDTKVIVLTSYAGDDNIFPAIKAGAAGYLLKDISPSDLTKAILAIDKGETHLHPEIAKRLMQEVADEKKTSRPEELTNRELDVLQLVATGLNNRDIADKLFISEKTVKTHVSNILRKLSLTDRTQAAIYAIKKGLA